MIEIVWIYCSVSDKLEAGWVQVSEKRNKLRRPEELKLSDRTRWPRRIIPWWPRRSILGWPRRIFWNTFQLREKPISAKEVNSGRSKSEIPMKSGARGVKDGQGPPAPFLWTMWTWTRLIVNQSLEPELVNQGSDLTVNWAKRISEDLIFNLDETGGPWRRHLHRTCGKSKHSNVKFWFSLRSHACCFRKHWIWSLRPYITWGPIYWTQSACIPLGSNNVHICGS